MRTIFKYNIELVMDLLLPIDAEVLCVQVQHGDPQMWVLLDESKPTIHRHFYTYGTGHTITLEYVRYISSFQLVNGSLVFHVFEDVSQFIP